MGFTVRDFNDLMRLLDRHPEWVEALRQRLLTRELLDSPKILRRLSLRVGRVERAVEDLKTTVQDLAQSVKALTESVATLTQAQQQRDEAFAAFRAEVDRRFAELAEAQRRTEEALAAHRAETDRRFAEMADTIRKLNETFAAHRQEFLEHRQEFLEHRAETDRRFAELAEAQRRTEEALAAHRAETDRRFAELAEAQRRHYEEFVAQRAETDRRFAELAEAQRRTEEALAAHRAETDRRFAELAEAQRRHYEEFVAQRAETDRRFAEMAEAIRALTQRVSDLDGLTRGWIHEDRYRTRSRRYRHLLLDPHILSVEEREQLLREAEAAGRLTAEEAAELDESDVLVRGRSRATGGEAFLVVEVSAKVDTDDVERAVERAEILRKARPEAEVIAVAAGPEIHPLAARAARDQGVWWLTDGRPYAPHEIPE